MVILCILRTLLTVLPSLNVELQPKLLDEYLLIKLNDLVVLSIWCLVSFICARSILGQYGVLKIGSFRQLFFSAFFESSNQLSASFKSAVVFILTALSVTYVARMVYFIYDQWSTELSPLLQSLQLYPALLMAFQTLYQGSYILKCLVSGSDRNSDFERHNQALKQQLLEHIWLNFTFILHSFCIFVVIRLCTIEPQILWQMVTGEVAYRLFAVCVFWKVLRSVDSFVPVRGVGENQVVYEPGEVVQPMQATTGEGRENKMKNQMVINQIVRPMEDLEVGPRLMGLKFGGQRGPEYGEVVHPSAEVGEDKGRAKSEMVIGLRSILNF